MRERRKRRDRETWNGSSGMVQSYPQSTLLAAAASRAKDKGRLTLSSVPTLRHLPYMPFRNTIRSACGSNGSHVSCVHVYPSHNENLLFPTPFPRPFIPPSGEFSFDGYALRSRIPEQRIIEAPACASRRYSTGHKIFRCVIRER